MLESFCNGLDFPGTQNRVEALVKQEFCDLDLPPWILKAFVGFFSSISPAGYTSTPLAKQAIRWLNKHWLDKHPDG